MSIIECFYIQLLFIMQAFFTIRIDFYSVNLDVDYL